jgi:phosphoribosylglycinamide formyltransferase-1
LAKLALGVLVSGNGSNLQAILDATRSGRLDASVRVVVSNQPQAYALTRARDAGVPAVVIPHREFSSREAFDEAVIDTLKREGVDWVVLAGFMRLLTPAFLAAFPGHVLNIHPALLPAFPGTHAIRDALAHGVRVTGCTVHLVDEGVDTGPILAQRAVPVLDDDTEQTLADRVHRAEHELYVEVLAAIAEGRLGKPRSQSES